MENNRIGIHNPFVSNNAHFDYEVVEDMGEIRTTEYVDEGRLCKWFEKDILIKTLSGNGPYFFGNELLVTLSNEDVNKPLEKGDLISIKLKFSVHKDQDGNYVQIISGENLFTLEDYRLVCEAEAELRKNNSSKEEVWN